MADPCPPSLADLAARAQKGDRKAFEQIVHATARLVYAHVVATVRDRQKAEDLTQETFVAAWKGIASFDGALRDATVRERPQENREKDGTPSGGGIIAWLLTVARNTTLDALKAESRLKRGGQKPATSSTQAGDVADQQGSPSDAAQRAEEIAHALSVLEDLPEEYRRVLSMRYLAGADYETIRRALELSDGALRGLLSRGMALMRERMTRDKVTR